MTARLERAEARFRAIHGTRPASVRSERIYLPAHVVGMGTLRWLRVRYPDGRRETWRFRPYPRLAFTFDVPDASGRHRRAHLHLVGGAYRVDARGFRNVGGGQSLRRIPVAAARERLGRERASARRTHGGLDPREATVGRLTVPPYLLDAALLEAIAYGADKAQERPRGDFAIHEHVFRADAAPRVTVGAAGAPIVLVGGAYTVTPHGIEDLEAAA